MLYGSQGCQYDQSHQGTMTQSTVDGLSRIVSVRPLGLFQYVGYANSARRSRVTPMPLRLQSHTYKSLPPRAPFDILYATTDRVHGVIVILCYHKDASVCKTERKGEFAIFFCKITGNVHQMSRPKGMSKCKQNASSFKSQFSSPPISSCYLYREE